MGARFDVTVDSSRMRLRLGKLSRGIAGPAMLEEAGHYMAQTALPMRFRQAGPGWSPVQRGGSPLRDRGALSRSFVYAVRLPDRAVEVTSTSIYAGPQHRGDTVRPRRGKYLAIPLPTLTKSQRRTKGPRDFKDTKVFKSRAGNLLIWRNRGSKRAPKWEPIFALKKSVKLTARPFMFISDENAVIIRRRMKRRLLEFAA